MITFLLSIFIAFILLVIVALTYDKTVTPLTNFIKRKSIVLKNRAQNVLADWWQSENIVRRNKLCSLFYGIAGTSIFLFFLFLHPASLWLGGLYFVLIGWVLPSIFLVSISLALACSFRFRTMFKIFIFFPIILIAGINTNFIHLYNSLNQPDRSITSTMIKTIKIGTEDAIDINYSGLRTSSYYRDGEAIFPINYFLSPVSVGGDVGCGCLYFTKRYSFYDRELSSFLKPIYRHNQKAKGKLKNIEIRIDASKVDSHTGQITIEVLKDQESCSLFSIRNIPLKNIKDRYGRDKRLLNGYFIKNTSEIFFHNHFVSYLLGKLSIFNAEKYRIEIHNFLQQCIRI